jgi:D-serine deaminase-like pyridoxal phosphate-dependent protein
MTLIAPPAARVGATLAEIGTPSLLIELDAFDANVRAMAEFAASCGVALRPHAKAHKSVAIARRQIAAGAVGVCCQKLSDEFVCVRDARVEAVWKIDARGLSR